MVSIATHISIDRVLQGANIRSQKRIFETLSQLLIEPEDEKLTVDELYQRIYEREKLGSTAVGNGIAIPHCRSKNITITRISVMTLVNPAKYATPDEKPVDVFVGIVFPDHVHNIHIKFMKQLAFVFKNDDFREKLKQAQTNAQLLQAMIQADQLLKSEQYAAQDDVEKN